jgi:hypothetical protein
VFMICLLFSSCDRSLSVVPTTLLTRFCRPVDSLPGSSESPSVGSLDTRWHPRRATSIESRSGVPPTRGAHTKSRGASLDHS